MLILLSVDSDIYCIIMRATQYSVLRLQMLDIGRYEKLRSMDDYDYPYSALPIDNLMTI